MRIRGPLLLTSLVTAAVVGLSCGSPQSNKILPPETLTSQQQAASQAVAASGAMHSLVFGVKQLLAIGNTTQLPSFAPVTSPPAGTPTPAPTQTSTSPATQTSTNSGSPTGSGASPTGSATSPTGFTSTATDPGDTPPSPTPTPGLGGDYSDPQANGIPADVTLVFVTNSFPAPIGIGPSQALFTTTDQTPSAAGTAAKKYSGGLTFAVEATTGLSFGWRKVDDLFRASYVSTALSGTFDTTASFVDTDSFQVDSAGHGHLCVSHGSWSMSYIPGAAYSAGSQLTDGTLAISNGDGFVAVDDTANAMRVTMRTTTSLAISASCQPTLFTGGTLRVVFGTNETVDPVADVHWTGCNQTSITKAH